MSQAAFDRELLFGLLALQNAFISREQLVTATGVWLEDKSQPLEQILLDRRMIDGSERDLLRNLVAKHLKSHDGDVQKSLAAINKVDVVTRALQKIDDQDVQRSVVHFAAGKAADPFATILGDSSDATTTGSRYQFLRPHARGGLGRVSVALDQELAREVALKEIHDEFADDESSRLRFVLEAEITGGLEHPGIVPVYGLGNFADGRPYYAMRFIQGDSLKDAISAFHRIDKNTPGEFGWKNASQRTAELRRLLNRFVDVCNAIEYAHSRGVLHRDLKPGNVMLGSFGETLVVDWGLAKSSVHTDDEPHRESSILKPRSGSTAPNTMMGSAIGTPAYMSPEQASGRLDQLGTATDIYSLGATLYHLLVGSAPFGNAPDILNLVQNGEFENPRQRNRRVPPALNAICLKAMAKRQDDRYPHARDLADDIENWLADEPVTAYKDPPLERAARWLRKHRSWAVAAAVSMLLITVVASLAAMAINQQRQIAVEQKRLAEASKQDAVARLRQANAAIETFLTGTSNVLESYPNMQAIRQRLLSRAAREYEQLLAEHSDDADIGLELARTNLRLGEVHLLLGDYAAAIQEYEKSRARLDELFSSGADPTECGLSLGNSHTKLGIALRESGDAVAADRAFVQAIDRLKSVAERNSDAPRVRDSLAKALLNRGILLVETSDPRSGEEHLRESIKRFEALVRDTADTRYVVSLAAARKALAETLTAQGENNQAVAELKDAIARMQTIAKEQPDEPEFLELLSGLLVTRAYAMRNLGRLQGEADALAGALANYQAMAVALPDVPRYQENIALTQYDLGVLQFDAGATQTARDNLLAAVQTFESFVTRFPQVPRYHEELAASHDALAQLLSELGNRDEARRLFDSSIERYQGLAKGFPDVSIYAGRLATVRVRRARLLQKTGELEMAIAELRTSISALDKLVRQIPNQPEFADSLAFAHECLGDVLRDEEAYADAKIEYLKAREIRAKLAESTSLPEFTNELAWLLANGGDDSIREPAAAVGHAKKACDIAPDNPKYRGTLAIALLRDGNTKASIAAAQKAIELRGGTNGFDSFVLAMALHDAGDEPNAGAAFDAATAWTDENRPDSFRLQRLRSEARERLGR